jgi:hypothetical protein
MGFFIGAKEIFLTNEMVHFGALNYFEELIWYAKIVVRNSLNTKWENFINGHVLKPKASLIVVRVVLDSLPFLLEVISASNFGIFSF